MKDITIEEAVKDMKELVEEYKDCSVEGLNMQVDVGFNEERCKNLEKILNELETYKHYYEELTTGQVKSAQLLKNYISKDKITSILGLEKETTEQTILQYIETLESENARLEDIEDRKVQIEYGLVFNKGVKSVEDKIRAKIKSLEEKIHIVIPNEYNKIEVMNEFKNEGAVHVLKELLEEN